MSNGNGTTFHERFFVVEDKIIVSMLVDELNGMILWIDVTEDELLKNIFTP